MCLKEAGVLARIRQLLPGGDSLLDDCGALPPAPPGQKLLVTTDLMESSQHFCLDWHPPDLLARKLLTVNLSDLDASGARPFGYTLTLALGPELDEDWLETFLRGLAAGSREAGVRVVGGLGLGLTAFGFATRWLGRGGLQPGDRIFLDQPPGASLRGLRKLQAGQRWDPRRPDPDLEAHLNPRPNLGLGVKLAAIAEVHACLDLSDGLSRDLRNLAEASRVSIVVAAGLDEAALQGGEDYARCFGSDLPQPELERRLGLDLFPVALAVEPGPEPLLVYDGSGTRALPDLGFDHFAHD